MRLDELKEKILRGTHEVLPIPDLEAKLRRYLEGGPPLRVKLGADPTAPHLHLGHYVVLRKLRELQELGFKIVFIVGDFTAMVGDPSGRSKTRPMLSREEVEENAKTYFEGVYRVLSPEGTEVRKNSEWLAKLSLADIIRLASCYTVSRMLERDDFAKRFREEIPIYIHEFLYPLLQGYDSYAISADIEVGGTDQKFNFLVGREVQRHFGAEPQVIMTLPLLRGTDGKLKMSSSYGNYIGIDEDPKEMYGKVMSIPDELMPEWYRLILGEEMPKGHPRDVKANLARRITETLWGPSAAREAEEHFNRVFRERELPREMPRFALPPGGIGVVELMVKVGFAKSRSEARRLIAQGGVRIDGERVQEDVLIKSPCVLRVGKRRFLRVVKDGE